MASVVNPRSRKMVKTAFTNKELGEYMKLTSRKFGYCHRGCELASVSFNLQEMFTSIQEGCGGIIIR